MHQQLANLADGEGISLNQYIVHALTRQVTLSYSVSSVPEEEIQQQPLACNALLKDLGRASSSEATAALAEREAVPRETELDANTVALLQKKIQHAVKTSSRTNHDD